MTAEEALFSDRVIKVGLIKYGQQIFDVGSININVTASSKATISFYVGVCVTVHTPGCVAMEATLDVRRPL